MTTRLAALGLAAVPAPEDLIGMAGARIRAIFGPPVFRRQDKPAEIWRYADGACMLDLFLYGDSGAMTVTHAETRGDDGIVGRACVSGLLKQIVTSASG